MRIGAVVTTQAVRDILKVSLELKGHGVSAYYDMKSLLEEMHDRQSLSPSTVFHLVILDPSLQNIAATVELLQQARVLLPQTPMLFLSTLPALMLDSLREQVPGMLVLQKPFTLAELGRTIEVATSYSPYETCIDRQGSSG